MNKGEGNSCSLLVKATEVFYRLQVKRYIMTYNIRLTLCVQRKLFVYKNKVEKNPSLIYSLTFLG